jgi:Domain of unknown function (DUF1707)
MCRHDPHPTELAARAEPPRRDVRASDAERDRAVEQLRVHAQAGRLSAEELERRVEQALRATTRADLDALQRDLPAERARPAVARRRHGAPPFVPIAILLIAIWAVTGAGYFWPLWPLLWFAFAGFARTTHFRVTGNMRRTW